MDIYLFPYHVPRRPRLLCQERHAAEIPLENLCRICFPAFDLRDDDSPDLKRCRRVCTVPVNRLHPHSHDQDNRYLRRARTAYRDGRRKRAYLATIQDEHMDLGFTHDPVCFLLVFVDFTENGTEPSKEAPFFY